MGRGGKRRNAGRKAGAVTKKTRAIADQAVATGIAPQEIMLNNARHFYQQALDAEATLALLTPSELGIAGLDPAEQFKVMMAEVKKVAGFRQLAQDCAAGAAPYFAPRLAPVQAGGSHSDEVPLVDRLKGYARTEAIESSKGKVVVLAKKARGS